MLGTLSLLVTYECRAVLLTRFPAARSYIPPRLAECPYVNVLGLGPPRGAYPSYVPLSLLLKLAGEEHALA